MITTQKIRGHSKSGGEVMDSGAPSQKRATVEARKEEICEERERVPFVLLRSHVHLANY